MKALGSQSLFAAGLFVAPEVKTAGHPPGLLSFAVVLVVILMPLALFRIGSPKHTPPEQEGGDDWGDGPDPPPPPQPRPQGGIPLDDATPARTRLRGPGRLADRRPPRIRRPAREPDRRPVRTTSPA
jgi:hypothetical protein